MPSFKNILPIFLFFFSGLTYADNTNEKIVFSKRLDKERIEAGTEIKNAVSEFKTAVASGANATTQTTKIKQRLRQSIASNDRHIDNIKKLTPPKGGEILKQATINNITIANNLLKHEVLDVLNADQANVSDVFQKIEKMQKQIKLLQENSQQLNQIRQHFLNTK